MAKLFGDTDIAVFADDIHVDHTTHELVVDQHGDGGDVRKVVTEAGVPRHSTTSARDAEKANGGPTTDRVEEVSEKV